MITRNTLATLRAMFMALVATIFIASCGGSSGTSGDPVEPPPPQPDTGIVGLWFTDLPTEKYSSIVLTVVEAVLIGGDGERQVLFDGTDGARHIDLLNLTNYSEPVVFGEVKAGNYTKLRLMLESIELVPADESPAFFIDKLPANGKVDLLQPDGFNVLPGRALMIEIDVDANKSIKITEAGNSGKVNFRPVVRVNIYDDGMPHKLARLEGMVSGEPNSTDGSFVLCGIDAPEHCVDIATGSMTSFFDDVGLGTDFGGLSEGAMVVVIGEYTNDPIVMDALVVEIGGTAEQVSGQVVSEPAESKFLVLTIDGMDVTIELQPGTKYYDANGPIGVDAIVLGTDVEVEGVMPPKDAETDPDLMRAALVFLEAPDDDLVSGEIIAPLMVGETDDPKNFGLTTEGGDICVNGDNDTVILLVDSVNSEVTTGTYADLALGQMVDIFGQLPEGEGCFDADEIIVDADPEPAP